MAGVGRRQQTTVTVTKLYRGKLRLERRNGSPHLYARTYIQGKNVVRSTGERTIGAATRVATDWYLELHDRVRKGEHLHGRLFSEIADAFLKHADQVREVSLGQTKNYRDKWNLLMPYFEGVKVTDVDARFLLTLRDKRAQNRTRRETPVKPATLKKDLIFVRLVLRHAKEWEKCLDELPQFPSFRGDTWSVVPSPRPFLNLEQWQTLRDLAKERISEADLNPRAKRQRQELYWFLLMCVGAALRVGEAYSLRFRDCTLVTLDDKDQTEALHMWVLGKHSRGGKREEAYGLYGAVSAFKQMQVARPAAKPDDPVFTENHREGIKELLTKAGLRVDKDGRTRDAKSLRQTGISMRLDLGPSPDYRDIAKWARTSPAMIATFYDQSHPQKSVERITGLRRSRRRRKKGSGES